MEIEFYKYQGTGNDFVIIDNRNGDFKKDTTVIRRLCDRRFGIGGDGLILLEADESSDFRMVYYNSDGNESSMCGNGGRCIVAFAQRLGIVSDNTTFNAIDGIHVANILQNGIIALQMKDVSEIKVYKDYVFLDTGSPHHVTLVSDLKDFDIKTEGAKIRYSELYGKTGSNVNFVSPESDDTFVVRTYERGVEDETLSCGTGVTAVALAMHALGKTEGSNIKLQVEGGALEVSFDYANGKYRTIFLKGPAEFVFKGTVTI